MDRQEAVIKECHKHGICSDGCPFKVFQEGKLEYICNNIENDISTIDFILATLGYTIDEWNLDKISEEELANLFSD